MKRKTSRNLFLAAIISLILSVVILVVSTPDQTTASTQAAGLGVTILLIVALLALFAAPVLAVIAWMGALIKMAKLGHWVWFMLLLVLNGFTMLIYIFAGPTEQAGAGLY